MYGIMIASKIVDCALHIQYTDLPPQNGTTELLG